MAEFVFKRILITCYILFFKSSCLLNGKPMIVSFFGPVAVCVFGNSVIYFLILSSLLRSGSKLTSTRRTTAIEQARRGGAISVILGLTWMSGVLAIGNAKLYFQYLFCIVNSLQGFMIFLFYCVFSTEVREVFRKKIDNWKVSSSGNGDSSFAEPETKMKEIRKEMSKTQYDEMSWQNSVNHTVPNFVDNDGFSE